MSPDTNSKSDFLAAEEIKVILGGREKAEQERIVRWVSESLDLALGTRSGRGVHGQDAPAHATPPATSTAPSSDHDVSRAKDMRTFVKEKQPASDMQFVAVVAYFFRFIAPEIERKDAITGGDLQTAARLARWRVFKEPNVPMNNAINQGYLDRAGRGVYRLNAVGENLVTMTLPATGDETSTKPARRKKQRDAKKGAGAKAKKRAG